MNAVPRPVNQISLQAALEEIRDGLRRMADGFHMLSLCDLVPSGPRAVQPAPEELLDVESARLVLGGVSVNSVLRLARRHPEVVRHVGRRTFYERGSLLRATRAGR